MCNKKDLKKKRVLKYFIEATQQIMETQSLEDITLRSVSDVAGYNGATLYNYFKDLDHLILFSSLKYLKFYNLEVIENTKNCKTGREKFFIMWESFCNISSKYPREFYKVFFSKHSKHLDSIIEQYYEIFPEDVSTEDNNLKKILVNANLFTRNKLALSEVILEEQSSNHNLDLLNEIIIALYHDLLVKVINSKDGDINITKKMKDYIDFILRKCNNNE